MLFFSLSFSQVVNIMSSLLTHFALFQGTLTNHLRDHKGSKRANSICKAWGILGTCIGNIVKTADGEHAQ